MQNTNNKGWVLLHRSIQDHEFWNDKPFNKALAWVDLIMLAAFEDHSIWVRGIEINVKRGQVAWSQKALAQRWGWSRGKVERFMKVLKTKQQIEQQIIYGNKFLFNLTTVKNYHDYQSTLLQNGQQNGQQTDSRRTADRAGINNGKELKETKQSYPQDTGHFVDNSKTSGLLENNLITDKDQFIQEYYKRKALGWRATYGQDLVCIADNHIRLKIHNGFVNFNDSLTKIVWIK